MIAIVTGDSRGIGKAIAERLYGLGYKTIGIARSNVKTDWIHVTGDITKEETWDKVLELIDQPIRVFVHNAGIHEKKTFEYNSLDEIKKVYEVNVFSAILGLKKLYKHIPRDENSLIVFISSITAFAGSNSGGIGYVSSKAALVGLAKQLSKELKPIRVNAIAPGYTETDMIKHWDEKRKEETIKRIPLGRLGKPEDIADVVEMLIKAKYINGQTIHVNGGLY
ncbi:NEQ306 [Nanoarchaeum equitans Kin4-M]|uniref:NEQ306 n=1 Tax=Nanoarchaeum equitans (strain Kin4-M) TaxID=228908 RepID=Q74NI5_NANEQ|nr:NEQ306 [Nanoarchaeum equitans Kin4-M]